MRYVRFLFKAITVCFNKNSGFDYKNNHKCNKLANFWLNKISKINYIILIIISYTLLLLESRKIPLIK